MLTRPQVQRHKAESGLRDIMIAEKEGALTFLLHLLSERGLLNHLAFKGGTCLRKMFLGEQRFSTDLDFTGLESRDHEDLILDMTQAFADPFQNRRSHDGIVAVWPSCSLRNSLGRPKRVLRPGSEHSGSSFRRIHADPSGCGRAPSRESR
jgi:predicted nucleotidyltransferase component of viral defense system